jgi:DNA repair protein RAD7
MRELRLAEIGRIADDWLDELCTLAGTLEYVDLSYPGKSLGEDALVCFLEIVGGGLTHLDLSGHTSIADEFLEDALMANMGRLQRLRLADVSSVTDEDVAGLFDAWADEDEEGCSNPPLVEVAMPRNQLLSTDALLAVLNHSGSALTRLDINGWMSTAREDALEALGNFCPKLRTVDLGFCREVNDFVIQNILDRCPDVKEIKIWGCTKVTETCPKKVSTPAF